MVSRKDIYLGIKEKKHTEETIRKLKEKKIWYIPWNKGRPWIEFRGERHPRWKGGKTSLPKQIRLSFKYRQWRSDIFTRDDFTCVVCGERGCYLEADHFPIRFVDIFKKYELKNLEEAENCEELWNINNGRTLCEKCHYKTLRK